MKKSLGCLSLLGFSQLVSLAAVFSSLWITTQIVPDVLVEGWGFLLLGSILWVCNLIYSLYAISTLLKNFLKKLMQILVKFVSNFEVGKQSLLEIKLMPIVFSLSIFLLDTLLIWLTGNLLSNVTINNWQANFLVALYFLLITYTINHLLLPPFYSFYKNWQQGLINLIVHVALFFIIPVVLLLTANFFPKLITVDSIIPAIITVVIIEAANYSVKMIGKTLNLQGNTQLREKLASKLPPTIAWSIIFVIFFLALFCLFPLYLWVANHLITGLIIQGYFPHLIVAIIILIASLPFKSWSDKLEEDFQKSLG